MSSRLKIRERSPPHASSRRGKYSASACSYGSRRSIRRSAAARTRSRRAAFVASPPGTMAAMDKRERKAILGDWGVRGENARERRERVTLERDLEGSPLV